MAATDNTATQDATRAKRVRLRAALIATTKPALARIIVGGVRDPVSVEVTTKTMNPIIQSAGRSRRVHMQSAKENAAEKAIGLRGMSEFAKTLPLNIRRPAYVGIVKPIYCK